MTGQLDAYARIVGERGIDQLRRMAKAFAGRSIVHVNSTKQGGGVAEILARMVPAMKELGMDARWEVVEGNSDFYLATKSIHNGLQGREVTVSSGLAKAYQDTLASNAERLRGVLQEADFVIIHDPQPAGLLELCPKRKGKWIWRCHIDVSRPHPPIWKFLSPRVEPYDASIWSLSDFVQPLSHPLCLIPPSIDPFHDKNVELEREENIEVCSGLGIDCTRPLAVQVSRFDRFKDPIGVLQAYRLAKEYIPALQVVLVGGPADDDPEGTEVLGEVQAHAADDADIHVLLLPPDSHRAINALQRMADVVIQKSLREGFGLTVTEGLWKSRPVIGGRTGGIRLQVFDYENGFLVNTPDGAAQRLCYLLSNPDELQRMGYNGHDFVRQHFLLTRHLRDYLCLLHALDCPGNQAISV